MAHDVFVSYAKEDQSVADAVVAGLEKEGLRCWVAPRDIEPGASWVEAINKGIEGSRFMVIVLSGNANRDNHVAREMEWAVANHMTLIPFRIEAVSPTGRMADFLSTTHWLDAFSPPLEKHIIKLAMRIHHSIETEVDLPQSPLAGAAGRVKAPEASEPRRAPIIPSQRAIMPLRSGGDGGPVQTPGVGGKPAGKPQPAALRQAEIPGADPVDFSVMAPQKVICGQMFLLQVFLHTPDEAEAAKALALEFDPDAKRLGLSQLEVDLLPGSVLMVELYLSGMDIDEPVQRLVWKSRTTSIQFGVSVPPDARPGPALGRLTLHHDGIPVGSLRFKVIVGARGAVPSLTPQRLEGEPKRYREAFISYSSKDRDEVLKRVQMLARLQIQFFQDVLNLEPGARWEQELYKHIDSCDLFLLFWSSASKASPWVDKEVQYALARQEKSGAESPEIVPVLIEGPPVPLPPEYLSHLHFNDRLLYFIEK